MMPKQRNESQEVISPSEQVISGAVIPSNIGKRPKTRGEPHAANIYLRGARPNRTRIGSHALAFESNSSFQSNPNPFMVKKQHPFFNKRAGQ